MTKGSDKGSFKYTGEFREAVYSRQSALAEDSFNLNEVSGMFAGNGYI
jgi:hypothetical protein